MTVMPSDEGPGLVRRVTVSMAGLLVRQGADLILSTQPLGVGLGVAVYDPVAKVGGLLHCLLPDSSIDAARAMKQPGLFLDTGFAGLVTKAQALQAKLEDLLVYAAGGGEILDDTGSFNLGKRTRDALFRLLEERGLRLDGEAVGGLDDCSLQINLATGEVRVKSSGCAKGKTLCKPSMIT